MERKREEGEEGEEEAENTNLSGEPSSNKRLRLLIPLHSPIHSTVTRPYILVSLEESWFRKKTAMAFEEELEEDTID